MSKKYIYMLFIFFIFIIFTSIFSLDYFNVEQVKYVYNSENLKCKYTISNIKDEQEDYKILAYYPITENSELNTKIMEKINLYIAMFKNELNGNLNSLTIKFNSYENEKYTSFVFDVAIINSETHKTEYVFTCNYDNEKSKVITIDDLLQSNNNNLTNISNSIFNNLKENESIKNYIDEDRIRKYLDLNKEKYECFYFNKDNIIFCFNIDTIAPKAAGIIYVKIQSECIK